MIRVRDVKILLQETYDNWNRHGAITLGGALAYFALFSIAPTLIIAIALAGLVFGRSAVSGHVYAQLAGLLGPQAAQTIQTMVQSAYQPSQDIVGTLVGLGALVIGAAGVFAELKYALNIVWGVRPPSSANLLGLIKAEFISFSTVVGIGFLLLISLLISAALTALTDFLNAIFPFLAPILHLVNFAVSFGFITLLFAMIFKVLPDVRISWRDVWVGAGITSLLFSLGKFAIGFYVGHSNLASGFGAAGSLVVVLVWVFYSALIVLFGAEFTRVFARHYGSGLHAAVGKHLAPPHGLDLHSRPQDDRRAS